MFKDKEEPCRKCKVVFQPKDWQIKHGDLECPSCRRIYERTRVQKDPNFKAKRREYNARPEVADRRHKYWAQYNKEEWNAIKRKARRLLGYQIEKGYMKRLPCENCGDIKTDAHHHDYLKPLDVNWFCRKCHYAEERSYAGTVTV